VCKIRAEALKRKGGGVIIREQIKKKKKNKMQIKSFRILYLLSNYLIPILVLHLNVYEDYVLLAMLSIFLLLIQIIIGVLIVKMVMLSQII
jgi:hypothetical protein